MPPGKWDGLDKLEPSQLVERLIGNLDALLAGHVGQPDDEDRVLRALPEPLTLLWYLNWLEFEVAQGSLSAYFMNSHGRHHRQAVRGLRRIGARRTAAVVEQAAAVVLGYADEWLTRRADLDAEGAFAVVHPYHDLPGAAELD